MTQTEVLQVVEIFRSLQGESSFSGLPFAFIRLAGCDVGCKWCDTPYARETPGKTMTLQQILLEADALGMNHVLITGGEPLMQRSTPQLAYRLTQMKYTVLVETSGIYDISLLPWPVIRIMDIKCPSSGVADRMDWYNLGHLRKKDEVKFVIADRADYEYARNIIEKYKLFNLCNILMSPVAKELEPGELADWILFDDLHARLQLQLHKVLWPDRVRGA